MQTDPTYPLFPIMSFLGFVVVLIPLPWHLQAWNSGTCAFMLWTSLACLVEFVNSIVWSDNLRDNVPVWCDISSKFLLGAGVGITASTLCISRRLYTITAVQSVSITRADKRRAVIVDVCISVGIPFLVMALHYVVQPHRYNILENIGCYAAIYNTIPAYFLVFMWPVLLGAISFVYSALTLRAFWKRRLQMSQLLPTNSALTMSRYIRLMMLSLTDMILTVPFGCFSIWFATHGVVLAPWISWEDTHFNFSRVELVPAIIWRSDPWNRTSVELTRWLFVISAFVFFILFGFAEEAIKHYRLLFNAICKPLHLKTVSASSKTYISTGKWSGNPDFKRKDVGLPVYFDINGENTNGGAPFSSKSSHFDIVSADTVFVHGTDSEKYSTVPSPSTTTFSDSAVLPKYHVSALYAL